MVTREITGKLAGPDGEVEALCNLEALWSPRPVGEVIEDIAKERYRYCVFRMTRTGELVAVPLRLETTAEGNTRIRFGDCSIEELPEA